MPSNKNTKPVKDRTDWATLRDMPEDEIERLAAEDEDNPPTDEDDWTDATIGLPPSKTSIHASFDRDVINFFKRGGRGYQTRMNDVLRRYMTDQQTKKIRD